MNAPDAVPSVLFTVPDLRKLGGVAAYCRTLLPHLAPEAIPLRRGSPGGERGAAALPRLARDTARVAVAVLAGNASVVHQNTSFGRSGMLRDAPLATLAKARGRRLFVMLHGWDERFEAPFRSRGHGWLRRVYFGADAIGVLGREFEEKLRAWGYRGTVVRETTVVDDALLRAAPPAEAGRPFTILFLARFAEDKGIFETIDAYRGLLAAHPTMRLVLAGDGPAMAAARERAAGLAGVRFTGYVGGAEKAAVFRSAHVYLLPTRHGEGLPTSVLEAMAFGLPVVTRPVAGLADHLQDGVGGLLTSRTDGATFAALVGRLAADEGLRRRMGEHNAALARASFLASAVAARLRSLYVRLAASEDTRTPADSA